GQNPIAKTPVPPAVPGATPNSVAAAPKPNAHGQAVKPASPTIAAKVPPKPNVVNNARPPGNNQPRVLNAPRRQPTPAASRPMPTRQVVAQAPKPRAQPKPQPQPKVAQQQVRKPPPPRKPPERKKCGAPGLPACH
ncbi:peptidase C14 caspase catalytic subunit p20, partial [Rhizobium sp. BR 314]